MKAQRRHASLLCISLTIQTAEYHLYPLLASPQPSCKCTASRVKNPSPLTLMAVYDYIDRLLLFGLIFSFLPVWTQVDLLFAFSCALCPGNKPLPGRYRQKRFSVMQDVNGEKVSFVYRFPSKIIDQPRLLPKME